VAGETADTRREETPEEHAERRWTELLQEVRVVQTGAQVLFGFLLAVAFTAKFDTLQGFDRSLYTVAVVLAAASTTTLISIVAFHLALRGRRLKPELTKITGWLVSVGVALLAGTMACSVFLLLRVVTGHTAAAVITGLVVVWFLTCWVVLPVLVHRRSTKVTDASVPGTPR
jgi:hypothetical protein